MTNVADSTALVQSESLSGSAPVGEFGLQTMAGGINYGIHNAGQVGDIVSSALDESTFQSLRNTTWVLCDGRSVPGSTFQTLTGMTNIPDLRGRYPRGRDHGAGTDPAGDLPIGTFEGDQTGSHIHDAGTGPGNLGARVALSTPTVLQLETFAVDGPHVWNSNQAIVATIGDTLATNIPTATRVAGVTDDAQNFIGQETRGKSTIVNYFIKIND